MAEDLSNDEGRGQGVSAAKARPGLALREVAERERPLILVVDDEQRVREVLMLRLRERNFEVLAAQDLLGAMMAAVDHRPDVILLDVRLGAENGLELVTLLSRAGLSHILTVVLTGHSGPADGFTAKELGVWRLLEKPADHDVIASTLRGAAAAAKEARLTLRLPKTVRSLLVVEAVRRIHQIFRTKGLSLEALARAMSVSARHLSRNFLREMKCSVIDYIHRCRIDAAIHLLKTTQQSIKAIAQDCGYHNSSELHRHFRRRTGQSPMAFRESRFVI